MSIMTSFQQQAKRFAGRGARNMLAAAGLGLLAATAAVAPSYAQQASVTQIATAAVSPEVAREVNARLKLLAPIIRSSPQEYSRLGYDQKTQENCSAQTGQFTNAIVALKADPLYAQVIALADIRDLENMARFASCTLPGGLKAKLNVCSTSGMSLQGRLVVTDVFDPRKMDVRPLGVRCPPAAPGQQASLRRPAVGQAAPRP